ncbi:MAG: gluconokinase [Blastocatellia bacterium]|nr:gluconokinase [Blastocatellia bacterium]MBN8722314.1 gluconokinase [Acidobacteriota bacterium]
MTKINIKKNLLICSIDLGTSSVRVLGYDNKGQAVKGLIVQQAYQMNTALDGKVEVAAKTLFSLIANCLDSFLEKVSKENYLIKAVSISSFWHSLMGIDSKAKAIMPLISWNDTRSHLAAKNLQASLNEIEIHQKTGCRLHSSYWPAKISWLSKKENFSEIKYWLSFADYLFLELFGELTTSISLASGTGLLDHNNCVWDKELIKNLPLEFSQLPRISEEPLKNLRPKFAGRWPELAKIPWFLAIGDGACSNIGSNCFDNTKFALMIGTSGAMRVVCERDFSIPSGLWSYRIDSRRSIIGGAISNAGNLFAWLKNTLILNLSDKALEIALNKIKADSHGLTLLPFFSGERSLGWNDNAKGAIIGLQLATKPIEILRAALEAIAYQFFLIYQELIKILDKPKVIVATGGGLYNSRVWGKIIADVIGENLGVISQAEASSRGAALLALEALNILKFDKSDNFKEIYKTNSDNKFVYQHAIGRYKNFYQKLVLEN